MSLLCVLPRLFHIYPLVSYQLKVPTTDKPGVTVNFRKLLLNRCQKEFEKDQDDDEIFEKKQKEMEAAKEVRNTFLLGCYIKGEGGKYQDIQKDFFLNIDVTISA